MNTPAPTSLSYRSFRAIPFLMASCFLVAMSADARAAEPAATIPSAPSPASAEATAPVKGESHPPRALRTVKPKHPEALYQKLIGGECEIECVVGLDGRVVYTKVVSASQPEFGPAAETALREWEFQPALRDGQPVPMTVRIPFSFGFTREQVLEIVAKRPVFRQVTEPVIPAEQLPVWPQPIQIFIPPYPNDLKGSGKHGKVVLSLIVDKEGHVINPKLVKATYPEFVMPALVTAVRLVFAPQKVGGQKPDAIYVSMDIEYDFTDPSRLTSSPGAAGKHPAEPKKTKSD